MAHTLISFVNFILLFTYSYTSSIANFTQKKYLNRKDPIEFSQHEQRTPVLSRSFSLHTTICATFPCNALTVFTIFNTNVSIKIFACYECASFTVFLLSFSPAPLTDFACKWLQTNKQNTNYSCADNNDGQPENRDLHQCHDLQF